MGDTLKQLGFSVMVAENQTRQAFSETLLAFDKAVEPGDTAFFFYAGHGFEIAGQNFLLPTIRRIAGAVSNKIRSRGRADSRSAKNPRYDRDQLAGISGVQRAPGLLNAPDVVSLRDPRGPHRNRLCGAGQGFENAALRSQGSLRDSP
jgi:Caspase domain